MEGRHVDVIEMDAASHTGIDDIREIIEQVRYRPVSARYKVYIIDEVHMLSTQAFNGLLKTLEEPPAHVKFIFATTEIRKVPITVLSRCQRFDLRRIDRPLMAHFKRRRPRKASAIDDESLAMIARAAEGSVRDGPVAARPGDRPWRRAGRCRSGARHAWPCRPLPRGRPVRQSDGRRCRRGAGELPRSV
jgi:DNA polymerase-3 subunit gamma/tau